MNYTTTEDGCDSMKVSLSWLFSAVPAELEHLDVAILDVKFNYTDFCDSSQRLKTVAFSRHIIIKNGVVLSR